MNHSEIVSFVWEVADLIRDTFRQAWASGISGMMLTVTALCVLLCLSVKVSGDVALHDKDETVLFLPPPAARAVITPESASPKATPA